MAPRVTVIIATWNWSSVLPYSIGSVLMQTFTDFELLVVGDGCTDDSETVVSAIADPRVRWINLTPRTGHQSGPNNEGLRQAKGELIAYLGHDDLWLPHHLTVAVAAIDAGADLTHSIIAGIVPHRPPLAYTMTGQHSMPPSGVVHRRQVTDAIGGWRDYRTVRQMPEQELWRRASAAGYRFCSLPRLTVAKFPASQRPDVYRERPSHEQAAWFARIRSEPDLETTELGKIALQLKAQEDTMNQQSSRLIDRLGRLLIQPRRWPSVVFRRNGDLIRADQRRKGVEPVS